MSFFNATVLNQSLNTQLYQAFQRGLYILVFVAFYDLSLGADDLGCIHARAMKIEPWIERFLIERIDVLSFYPLPSPPPAWGRAKRGGRMMLLNFILLIMTAGTVKPNGVPRQSRGFTSFN